MSTGAESGVIPKEIEPVIFVGYVLLNGVKFPTILLIPIDEIDKHYTFGQCAKKLATILSDDGKISQEMELAFDPPSRTNHDLLPFEEKEIAAFQKLMQ